MLNFGASKPRVGGMPLEAFAFLMLKYAFSYILGALFLSFLTVSPKTDINSTLHCTSNNPLIF